MILDLWRVTLNGVSSRPQPALSGVHQASICLYVKGLFCSFFKTIWLTSISHQNCNCWHGLWDDTRIVPCDSQLWEIQCTWSSYRDNWMLLGLGVCILRLKISAIRTKFKRALFPYNDSCHVNYSAHIVSVPWVNFPALVATSIVAVCSYSGLTGCIHNTIVCQFLYLATQMTLT